MIIKPVKTPAVPVSSFESVKSFTRIMDIDPRYPLETPNNETSSIDHRSFVKINQPFAQQRRGGIRHKRKSEKIQIVSFVTYFRYSTTKRPAQSKRAKENSNIKDHHFVFCRYEKLKLSISVTIDGHRTRVEQKIRKTLLSG